ncbi:fumarylacetoacetate hydrolase family protein [Sneathiella glossodoripedis]|uniref:fumarylacetoacetate hydrolase family protein n=1 Tax=Sneathiella glossodoripedis TaxID=418853 RepID=UPI00047158A7|nr:fumarylacetoacetate hydrolase family protein [Sneathiella glossodoripedis]
MNYAFEPEATPALPITGQTSLYPVRRIYCVGRNYAEHSLEMGGDPTREAPFFFSKPANTIVQTNTEVTYPQATENFHFEMELVIAIAKEGRDLQPEETAEYIFGYAAGIDLTRRDLQNEAKDKRRPWDTSKGFDQSAPCGPITPASNIQALESSRIWLDVNGSRKQDAKISDMIWNPFEIVSHLSHFFVIKPGDIVFTGTPAGVGQIQKGDVLTGGIDGLENISIAIR